MSIILYSDNDSNIEIKQFKDFQFIAMQSNNNTIPISLLKQNAGKKVTHLHVENCPICPIRCTKVKLGLDFVKLK